MLFDDILNMKADEATLSKALRLLSDMLHAHYGRKVVILVDEYDSSVNGVYGTQDQRTISEFTRDFLSSALKGNDSLKLTVVTGVM